MMTNTETQTTVAETMAYTDAYLEHGRAYFAALSADEQWQRELDFQDVDRYSPEARGVAGEASQLRLLYEAKLRADEELKSATDTLKASGTEAEVEAVMSLQSEQS